jgi:hypothetical protein
VYLVSLCVCVCVCVCVHVLYPGRLDCRSCNLRWFGRLVCSTVLFKQHTNTYTQTQTQTQTQLIVSVSVFGLSLCVCVCVRACVCTCCTPAGSNIFLGSRRASSRQARGHPVKARVGALFWSRWLCLPSMLGVLIPLAVLPQASEQCLWASKQLPFSHAGIT